MQWEQRNPEPPSETIAEKKV